MDGVVFFFENMDLLFSVFCLLCSFRFQLAGFDSIQPAERFRCLPAVAEGAATTTTTASLQDFCLLAC
jgi:hypothetical protein